MVGECLSYCSRDSRAEAVGGIKVNVGAAGEVCQGCRHCIILLRPPPALLKMLMPTPLCLGRHTESRGRLAAVLKYPGLNFTVLMFSF